MDENARKLFVGKFPVKSLFSELINIGKLALKKSRKLFLREYSFSDYKLTDTLVPVSVPSETAAH